jgi:hypothetical protein
MTTCTLTTTVQPSLASRFLDALVRYFGQSVLTREAIDQSWLDSGLGRLDRHTLEDIGAPARLIDVAREREAWKIASALDATRHL